MPGVPGGPILPYNQRYCVITGGEWVGCERPIARVCGK